jgi:hypothetical protein
MMLSRASTGMVLMNIFLFCTVVCRHGDKCSLIKAQHSDDDISARLISTQDFTSPETPAAVCMRLVTYISPVFYFSNVGASSLVAYVCAFPFASREQW